MSKNIVEITQSDSISKDSLPRKEITPERKLTNLKVLCGAKKIVLISLLIFLIVTLFISCAYLLLSQNKKTSLNLDELRNEKRRTPVLGSHFNKETKLLPLQTKEDMIEGGSSQMPARIVRAVTGYERNVLLVTNYISKKGNWQNKVSPDVLYNILKQLKKVTLTIIDAYDTNLNSKSVSYLKNFNLVVIDFVDGGFNLASRCPSFVKALMQYIKEGGALFTCHDQFDDTHSRYITQEALEMLNLLGLKHYNYHGNSGSTVYFDKTAISNSIFVSNHAMYGDSFSVSYTHQTYSRYDESCTTCKVILKFNSASAANSYEYLVTNRPYKGKTLNIRAGHTTGFTEAEKKIFLSSILWLLYEI